MTSPSDLSRDELLDLLSAVPDTVLLIDEDFTIRYLNTPEMGYREEDVVGTSALDFIVPSEHRDAMEGRLRRVFESGQPESFELPVLEPEGGVRWVEGTLTPIRREGRVTVASVSRDVTARHRAEEEAEKLRKLVPVCSWCGRIRSDEGYWSKIEQYIQEETDAEVTHGMCPDCESEIDGDGARDSA